ncbi:MAG: hypothetical protein ACREOD_00895 [Candidatus Dormibacteria bacterium]
METSSEQQRAQSSRQAQGLSWESESGPERADRRSHLSELDQVLEVLEALNLEGTRRVPPAVRRRLELSGIATQAEESPSAVLERVLSGQEVYLLHPTVVGRPGLDPQLPGAAGA